MAPKKKKGKDLDDVITSNLEANKGGERLIKHSIYFYRFVCYGTAFIGLSCGKKHHNNHQGRCSWSQMHPPVSGVQGWQGGQRSNYEDYFKSFCLCSLEKR